MSGAMHTALEDCTRAMRKLREEKAALVANLEDAYAVIVSRVQLDTPGLAPILASIQAALKKAKGQ